MKVRKLVKQKTYFFSHHGILNISISVFFLGSAISVQHVTHVIRSRNVFSVSLLFMASAYVSIGTCRLNINAVLQIALLTNPITHSNSTRNSNFPLKSGSFRIVGVRFFIFYFNLKIANCYTLNGTPCHVAAVMG